MWRRLRRRRLLGRRLAESRRKRLAAESVLCCSSLVSGHQSAKASFCWLVASSAGTAPHDALGMIHFAAPLFLDFCCSFWLSMDLFFFLFRSLCSLTHFGYPTYRTLFPPQSLRFLITSSLSFPTHFCSSLPCFVDTDFFY